MLDLLIRDARLQDREGMVDIGIAGGRIAAVGTGLVCDAPAVARGPADLQPGGVHTASTDLCSIA